MFYWSLIILLGLGWGSSFFFNEILLRELGPFWLGVGRVGTGAIGCWLFLLAARRPVRLPNAVLARLGVFGMFQYAFPFVIYPFTQQFITSSAAGIVNALTPAMVVLVGQFWPGADRAGPSKMIGVGLGFAGIVVLALPAMGGQGPSAAWALLLTVLAPLSYGVALNYSRSLNDVDRVLMTAWSLSIGAVAILPVAILIEGIPTITRGETWAALAVIGFVLTAAAFILLFWLLPRVGPLTTSTITFIAPVSAVLLGVLVLGEELGPVQLSGMVVIFAGLIFIDGKLLPVRRNSQPEG